MEAWTCVLYLSKIMFRTWKKLCPHRWETSMKIHLLLFRIFLFQILSKEVFGHGTPYFCTLHICNKSTFKSNQFASYSFGPIRKFRSVIRSSSLTSVAAIITIEVT
jgi:hypothetical protein